MESFLGSVLAVSMLSDLTTKLIDMVPVTTTKKFVFYYRGFQYLRIHKSCQSRFKIKVLIVLSPKSLLDQFQKLLGEYARVSVQTPPLGY